jgi:hypothetical protein
MNSSNHEEEEFALENSKARSNPSRLSDKRRSKENSLDLQRWHSFKDELIKERKDHHSFSSQMQKVSTGEHSDPKIHSLILQDKSNSELKSSVASKYVEYIDHFKKTYIELTKKGEEGEGAKEGYRVKIHKDSNILLNSTILSNCFNDRSFHDPIHELSNEADFIEESNSGDNDPDEDQEGEDILFDENNKEGLSKIYNPLEGGSFSFDNNRMLSGFFDEIKENERSGSKRRIAVRNLERTFDTIENLDRLDPNHFYEKDPKLQDSVKSLVTTYDPTDEYIKIIAMHLSLGENKFSDEYILTSKGLVNSKKNTKVKSLVIGRMSSVIEDVRPNDIILPFSDKAISRVHCAIAFKQGFRNRRLNRGFATFLSGKHEPIGGSRCPVRRLTKDLLMRIYSYLRPANKIYAIDLGSTTGTYKRILPGTPWEMKKDDIFMVGNSFQFSITYANSVLTKNANLNDLFQMLADEPEERTEIHGLTPEQTRKVEHFREKKKMVIDEILKEEGDSSMHSQTPGADFLFPMLVFGIENPSSNAKAIQ